MMDEFITGNQGIIRFAAFALILGIMLAWQARTPFRAGQMTRRRAAANIGLVAVDVVILRVLFPAAGVGAAVFASQHEVGLLRLTELPVWLVVTVSIVALDLAVYAQHVATHHIAFLWRLHRVHHSDLGFDATTALRFHPAEIVLSMLLKIATIVALGVPAIAVVFSRSCSMARQSSITLTSGCRPGSIACCEG